MTVNAAHPKRSGNQRLLWVIWDVYDPRNFSEKISTTIPICKITVRKIHLPQSLGKGRKTLIIYEILVLTSHLQQKGRQKSAHDWSQNSDFNCIPTVSQQEKFCYSKRNSRTILQLPIEQIYIKQLSPTGCLYKVFDIPQTPHSPVLSYIYIFLTIFFYQNHIVVPPIQPN